MKRFLVILSLLIANLSYGQNCNCDSLFLQTQKIVEDNYAGWFDKVTSNNRTNYNQWTDKHSTLAKKITTDSTCARQLQEWISFFKDKHLRIKFTQPKAVQGNKPAPKEITILSTNLTESQIMAYYSKSKKLDAIEGIYESASYKLGITKVKPNLFYATIITTSNENWKPGEVKLVIKKIGTQYEGTFYEGDKSDISTHQVQVEGNILDFDIVFYEKIFPTQKVKLDITEYEMSKDKRYAPSITFKDNVAIWKFPSFENNSFEQTTYLLKKYQKELQTTPYWLIDLTDNSGGDYRVGMQLIQYLYTKPIIEYNREMRMTTSNLDMWFKTFVKSAYDQLDEKTKKEWDAEINEMKSKIGTMYNGKGKATDTLNLNKKLEYPKKVALLINNNTISSGELFTMVARQSDKVIVLGQNTGGMMDYGNIVHYKTSCPTIRVQLPMDRQLWLDTGFTVDKEGLKPDIYLTGKNWTEQAIKIVKK